MKKGYIVLIFLVVISAIVLAILFLKPKDSVKVTFNYGNGTTDKIVDVVDGKVQEPSKPTRSGYNFLGWYNGNIVFDFDTEVKENLTLSAKWEKIDEPINNYSVTFDVDSGSSVEKQLIKAGEKVTQPDEPIKEGYIFVEWQLNGESYDFDTPVTKNIELKAIWEKVPVAENKVTVAFNSNGGNRINSRVISSGSVVSKPSNPTRTGYTFVEWQLNGVAYNFSTKVTKNITLKAVWRANPVAVTYSYKWEKVADSTADQYKLFIVSSTGGYVSGTVTINYVGGGSEDFSITTTGRMFPYKTDTIASVTNIRVN